MTSPSAIVDILRFDILPHPYRIHLLAHVTNPHLVYAYVLFSATISLPATAVNSFLVDMPNHVLLHFHCPPELPPDSTLMRTLRSYDASNNLISSLEFHPLLIQNKSATSPSSSSSISMSAPSKPLSPSSSLVQRSMYHRRSRKYPSTDMRGSPMQPIFVRAPINSPPVAHSFSSVSHLNSACPPNIPSPSATNTPATTSNSAHHPGDHASSSSSSSHYARAVLKLEDELESMTTDWAPAELLEKRRLVRFWRRQDGNIVLATFAPIDRMSFLSASSKLSSSTPASAPHTSDTSDQTSDDDGSLIVISCIWKESSNEYFVTSVDTIYLLEALVASRFTVEEKNRIRRNLEGFRPHTVSKTKAESGDFFRLIMGFTAPKPRNIEKNVKVFPWRILSSALCKIISKYAATYPSTTDTHTAIGWPTSFQSPSSMSPASINSAEQDMQAKPSDGLESTKTSMTLNDPQRPSSPSSCSSSQSVWNFNTPSYNSDMFSAPVAPKLIHPSQDTNNVLPMRLSDQITPPSHRFSPMMAYIPRDHLADQPPTSSWSAADADRPMKHAETFIPYGTTAATATAATTTSYYPQEQIAALAAAAADMKLHNQYFLPLNTQPQDSIRLQHHHPHPHHQQQNDNNDGYSTTSPFENGICSQSAVVVDSWRNGIPPEIEDKLDESQEVRDNNRGIMMVQHDGYIQQQPPQQHQQEQHEQDMYRTRQGNSTYDLLSTDEYQDAAVSSASSMPPPAEFSFKYHHVNGQVKVQPPAKMCA